MDDVRIKFCPHCGHGLERREYHGDVRPVCPQCDYVHFFDPKIAAAVLVENDDGKVLMVRRVMEPRQGKWTIPGGFIDRGEDPAEAATRECREETGLEIEIDGLFDYVPGQEHEAGADVVLVFKARFHDGELRAGDDADQVGWFGPHEIPPIAFRATQVIIDRWRGSHTGNNEDAAA